MWRYGEDTSTTNTTCLTSTRATGDPILESPPPTLPFRPIASGVAERQSSVVLAAIVVAVFPDVLDWVIEVFRDVQAAANTVALVVVLSIASNTSTSPAPSQDSVELGTGAAVQTTVPRTEHPNIAKASGQQSHVAPWMPRSQVTFLCVEEEPIKGKSAGDVNVDGQELLRRQSTGRS